MTLLDPQSEWARLVLVAFADVGVRELVLSPGSRSTPLVLAAAHEPRLRIHTILDERAAAFFALGQARVTGTPSLLLCTSGSAPAHYFPAVVEAHHAHVPLLVLTADRPLEAQHAAAPQTIDQTRLFGTHAEAFFELGGVDAAPSALRGTRRIIAQAVALAANGAVHLNARLRKPLEPYEPTDPEPSRQIRAASSAPPTHFQLGTLVSHANLAALRARIVEEPRGIIAVGPLRGPDPALTTALLALSARTGYPLVVEPTSHVGEGICGALTTVFASDASRAALQPRVVLQVGPPPVAASWERIVADAAHLEIFASFAEVDSESRARVVHVGDPGERARTLTAALPALPALDRTDYARRVRTAHDRIATALRAALAPTDELASVLAVMTAAERVRPTMLVGNSLPVRELSAAAALLPRSSLAVHHQRGTSGIDGLCAGAAGIASTGAPTLLLLGDVSLLHDLHGTFIAGQSKVPLVIAVVCNGGGRIFDTLPIGRRDDLRGSLALFDTPVSPDLATLACFCGMTHVRTESANDVEAALMVALSRPSATLLELVVDPESAARWAARLPALVDQAAL